MVLTACQRNTHFIAEIFYKLSAVNPFRYIHPCCSIAWAVRRKGLKIHCLYSSPCCPCKPVVPCKHIFKPLFLYHPERLPQPYNKRGCGCIRSCIILQVLTLLLEIKVEPGALCCFHEFPCLFAKCGKCKAGRQHECLLRTGNKYIYPQLIHGHREDADSGYTVHYKEAVLAVFSKLRQLFYRMGNCGGCFACLHHNAFYLRIGVKNFLYILRVNRLSPFHIKPVGLKAVGLRYLPPSFPEFTAVYNNDLISGRKEVCHRAFHP